MRRLWVISGLIALVPQINVHLSPGGYEPRNFAITAGTTVVFENTTMVDLWPASNIHPTHALYPEFDPRAPIAPGASWRFTFTKTGVWTYHDHLYPSVTGTITVNQPSDTLVAWLTKTAHAMYTTLWQQSFTAYSFDRSINRSSTAIYTDVNALYSYIRRYGLPDTMQHLTDLSGRLGSCHDAAHKAGRIAYELKGDEAFTSCTAACHSGCYHGATESFFRDHGTANLAADLELLCNVKLNAFISHQCLHGIGHGLMAWANYEIQDALPACDLLNRGRDSCYTGVFMENVVGALDNGSDGHYTKYVNADPQYPCTLVEEKYKSACYFYQTSRMIQLFGPAWLKIADACTAAPTRFYRYCFESMGRDVGGVYPTDTAGAIKACRSVSDAQNRVHCLNGAVQNYFWEPAGQTAALHFCQLLTDETEHTACLDTVAQRAALLGLP